MVVEQQWQEPTVEEQDKHLSIEKLQVSLAEWRVSVSWFFLFVFVATWVERLRGSMPADVKQTLFVS